MTQSQRLHAADNLRAVLMWLGIVLHVAANHLMGGSSLFFHDPKKSIVADLLFVFIHAFRMPAFFILAGFFVATLVSRRGYEGMLKHRLRRIGLPFVVFWPPIYLATIALLMLHIHLQATGSWGFDPKLIHADPTQPTISTMHMWFMYYLLWFCLLTALIGQATRHLSEQFKEQLAHCWMVLASAWWGIVLLAMPLAVIGSFYKLGIFSASASFVPHAGELLYNGLFFMFGLYLFRQQESLLQLYSKHAWPYALSGLILFIVFLGLADTAQRAPGKIPNAQLLLAFIYGCMSWLWSFALIGLFVRYLPRQNRFLRYMSESSYWVYLVHLPVTIGFGMMLHDMPLNALAKMGINILATTAACIATYHVLVRYSPIASLLTGQRRRFADIKKTVAANAIPK